MNWTKILFLLLIVLLYIPMVFLGANVFFPEYTGPDSYYRGYGPGKDCYNIYGPIDDKTDADIRSERQSKINDCLAKQEEESRQFEKAKAAYEGQKYTFIALFNLLVIIVALFWKSLSDIIMMGLFVGPMLSTFIATMRFFDTNSKVGFGLLVVTFFLSLFFINRKRATFFDFAMHAKKK